ncbi:zinc finger protein 771-like isoform X2 [Notolabrus celidotus]|uniref:zinc finger protein 771-like isoform X2 n=1 Tax=Notolabrus celidotus TaxID=1203425 RepID=UPI00148F4DE9|nr:zinc finger protein 771-like isoform X2 [Notolabrus celidotus]
MSKVHTLRGLVKQRLTAAAEEIFELFERTIAEYEEQLSRSAEENQRQQKLLDAVYNPEVLLHRADVQQLGENKEEVPSEQQEWSSSPDQEDPPDPPHNKEEQEELWISQEGDQLQGLEETETTKVTLTPVPVKSEDDDGEKPQPSQLHENQTEENRDTEGLKTEEDEEEPQSSQLSQIQTEQMETGADGEECGGPGPDRSGDEDTSEAETEDSDEWGETTEHQSGLDSVKQRNKESQETKKKPHRCSECGKTFREKGMVAQHMRTHTGEKPFSCSQCGTRFGQRHSLKRHKITHTEEKPYSCSRCGKRFNQNGNLLRHIRIHKEEKLLSCSVCGKKFKDKGNLSRHMSVHEKEKPFSCSVCKKSYYYIKALIRHTDVHIREQLLS